MQQNKLPSQYTSGMFDHRSIFQCIAARVFHSILQKRRTILVIFLQMAKCILFCIDVLKMSAIHIYDKIKDITCAKIGTFVLKFLVPNTNVMRVSVSFFIVKPNRTKPFSFETSPNATSSPVQRVTLHIICMHCL